MQKTNRKSKSSLVASTTRSIGEALTNLCTEDLTPRMHIIEALRRENDDWQRSQPMVVEYGWSHLADNKEARRL